MTDTQADVPKGTDPRRRKRNSNVWEFLDDHSEGFYWIAFWLVVGGLAVFGIRAILTNVTDDRQDRRQKFETCVNAGGTYVNGACVVPQR